MFTNTKIALAIALILGAGSAALANDVNGDVSAAEAQRDWQESLGQNQKHIGNAGTSYGYFGPLMDDQSGKKNRNR